MFSFDAGLTAMVSATMPCRYELLHVVRTHMGSSDASYGCVFQKEDTEGRTGVFLSKELMSIAGHALKANITTLGPLVLPLSEQILFFLNLISRKVALPVLQRNLRSVPVFLHPVSAELSLEMPCKGNAICPPFPTRCHPQ